MQMWGAKDAMKAPESADNTGWCTFSISDLQKCTAELARDCSSFTILLRAVVKQQLVDRATSFLRQMHEGKVDRHSWLGWSHGLFLQSVELFDQVSQVYLKRDKAKETQLMS